MRTTMGRVVVIAMVVMGMMMEETRGGGIPAVIKVSGTHREIGHSMGEQMADSISTFLSTYANLQKVLLPYVATPQGANYLSRLEAAARKMYPAYMEELEGMVEGAGVDFHTALTLQFEDELSTLMRSTPNDEDKAEGFKEACSDVHVANARVLAHNEDNYPSVGDYAYMVVAKVEDDGLLPERGEYGFVAYAYPGYLVGIAFGMTSSGLGMSCNAVFPASANPDGAGDTFISRDILAASSMDDAIFRAVPNSVSNGLSLNFISMVEDQQAKQINLEVSTNGSSVLVVDGDSISPIVRGGTLFHANMYLHSEWVNQFNDPSSQAREATFASLLLPYDARGARDVLGNTNNKAYPIYRDAHPPDVCSTLASAVFDGVNGTMAVYFSNPSLAPAPDMVFNVHDL